MASPCVSLFVSLASCTAHTTHYSLRCTMCVSPHGRAEGHEDPVERGAPRVGYCSREGAHAVTSPRLAESARSSAEKLWPV